MAKTTRGAEAPAWRNRIVGQGEASPMDLVPNPANYRRHPKNQADATAGAISELGWIQQIVVNKRTGRLIDGHLRLSLAIERKEPSVPVLYVDLSEAEEKLALVTLDPLAAMAEADATALDALLRDVQVSDENVVKMLADLAAESGLTYGAEEAKAEDPGGEVDRAAELQTKWQTARGQAWEIGKHRLMCGDSTSAEDVARLMDGKRATLLLADPPYGIGKSYAGESLSEAEFSVFHGEWLDAALAVVDGADTPCYVFTGCKTLLAFGDVIRIRLSNPRLLVWYRPDGHGAGGSDYFYNYDPIFYGSQSGKIGRFVFDGEARDVWVINRSRESEGGFEHETVKPIAVAVQPILTSSMQGDVVLDPFLGSGTTMVAAEQTGRICYGMELEPKYVAVALERMLKMGLTPRLV